MMRIGTQRQQSAAVQQRATPDPTPDNSATSSNSSTNSRMVVPRPIVTREPHFSSPASVSVSAGTSGNEVVIDGESSATDSDEDEVMVITPQSRKRKRTSAIMDEDDDGEEEEEKEEAESEGASASSSAKTTPAANSKRMFLSPELRDGSRAITNFFQKAASTEGRSAEDKAVENVDNDDDDDEVEIVQIGSAAKPLDGSASKKNRRLTIEDTDDENDREQELAAASSRTTPSRRRSSVGAGYGTPGTADRSPTTAGGTPGSSASSSRRSSRIERKRQEKESEMPRSRKLTFLSLDNCLDPIKTTTKRDADGTEEEEEEEGDDFEEEEITVDSKRRAFRETEREVLHADADDDMDEFIVGDNEVEYMDDDENGVISVESGSEDDDENDFNELDDLAAHRAAQQTRERHEWFAIYMEYLEESIIDADLDNKMRRRVKPEYRLYREAIHHIERELCSRRDSLRGNVVWSDEMMDALKHASYFRSSRCSAEYECEACKRQNHMATYDAHLGGISCDSSELYRENWMQKLRKSMRQAKPVSATFQMGSVCHARTLAYWQLLHAKHFWCILVDAKRKAVGDVTGRISEQFRTEFFKQEFGRYKRLLSLVETFETEGSRQTNAYMSNVWKKVTPQHLKSDFLPPAGKRQSAGEGGRESRRGTIDSFVAESEESEDEDDGDEEENEVVNEDEEEPEVEQKSDIVHTGERSGTQGDVLPTAGKPGKSLASNNNSSSSNSREEAETSRSAVKHEATEVEDLLCLVCGENPRNGGIMHGQYLHFYCCFRCGKRQFRAKMGCLVCDRPIDKVLRLLPLTPEARKAIKEHK